MYIEQNTLNNIYLLSDTHTGISHTKDVKRPLLPLLFLSILATHRSFTLEASN